MIKKIIPISEVQNYFETIAGAGLEKDLHETEYYKEEICKRCHGTGIVLAENPYGLSEEKTPVRFPYRQQAFTFCPDCFNGIRKRCKVCGELIPRGMLIHNCQQVNYHPRQVGNSILLTSKQASSFHPPQRNLKQRTCLAKPIGE